MVAVRACRSRLQREDVGEDRGRDRAPGPPEPRTERLTEHPAGRYRRRPAGSLCAARRCWTSEARLRDQASILEMIAKGMPLDETLTEICRVVEAHIPGTACAVVVGGEIPARADGGQLDASGRPRARAGRSPIPAFTDGRTLGTLDVTFDEPRQPTEGDEEVVDAVVQLAAIAIERDEFEDRLAYQAKHDPLTGLPNRVLFVELLGARASHGAPRRQVRARGALPRPRPLQDRQRQPRPRGRRRAPGDARAPPARCAAPRRHRRPLRRRRVHRALRGPATPAAAAGRRSTSPNGCSTRCRPRSTATARTSSSARASGSRSRPSGDERPESSCATPTPRCTAPRTRARAGGRCSTRRCARRRAPRHEIENALHRALERDEFRVFYQPIVSLAGRTVVGVEALVRWQHPERGLLAPADFIAARRGDRASSCRSGAWLVAGGVPPDHGVAGAPGSAAAASRSR